MTGPEHRFDRWAKRLAGGGEPPQRASSTPSALGGGISRRRLLVAGAAGAVGMAFRRAPRAIAASSSTAAVTACSCEDYGNYVYATCAASYFSPTITGSGMGAAMAIGNRALIDHLQCSGPSQAAQANCREVPCSNGERCVTTIDPRPGHSKPPTCACPDGSTPDFQSDNNNCGSCGHVCVAPSTCQSGRCVCTGCNPPCPSDQTCNTATCTCVVKA